jgi:hypothetical protein
MKGNNMKAMDCKYGQVVRVIGEPTAPPDAPEVNDGEVVKIFRLDGMYVNGQNEYGDRVYIPAWQDVEVINEISIPSI